MMCVCLGLGLCTIHACDPPWERLSFHGRWMKQIDTPMIRKVYWINKCCWKKILDAMKLFDWSLNALWRRCFIWMCVNWLLLLHQVDLVDNDGQQNNVGASNCCLFAISRCDFARNAHIRMSLNVRIIWLAIKNHSHFFINERQHFFFVRSFVRCYLSKLFHNPVSLWPLWLWLDNHLVHHCSCDWVSECVSVCCGYWRRLSCSRRL